MKIIVNFLIIYLISVGSIFSVYINLHNEYKDEMYTSEREIHGVTYLRALSSLAMNVATYHGDYLVNNDSKAQESKIKKNIQEIYLLQKVHPACTNETFNKKMEKLKYFNMTSQEYYDFLNDIGHENYRVGDISELLFEKDRKVYYLTSLLTHYMPESLISLLINHNIIEELLYTSHISDKKKNIFIEQTKLIYLSSEEIAAIVQELGQYEDTKVLINYMESVSAKLTKISNEVDTEKLFALDKKQLHKYISITHEVLAYSYLLNDKYIEVIEDSLLQRNLNIQEKILTMNIIVIFILLLISMLLFYAYQLYRAQEDKNTDLELANVKTKNALEFKTKFLSNMSHEIRTPLNAVVGLVKIMLKTKLSDKQSDIMKKVNLSSELLLGVINDILDISKIESGKMHIEKHDFNLKGSIDNIKSMFMEQADEKGLSVEVNYGGISDFNRIGDSLRITQVLTNLVSNAIKFTSKGDILISLQERANNKIRFEVKDSGIGLRKGQIETLFEEFTQADMDTTRKYGGTGLGLAISKNLVEMMGGTLSVKSEYGIGSSFIFMIEMLPSKLNDLEKVKEKTLEELEEEINSLEDIVILVAEDNKMNQSLLSMLLEDSKLQLEFALDGMSAVEMFKKKDYDLILMDIQMPNMNGYEATEIIRESDPNIPIIALSANVMEEDIEKSLASGMNSHIAKPIDMKILYIELLKFIG